MRRWLPAFCLRVPRRRSVGAHDRPDPTETSGESKVEPQGSNSTADPQSSSRVSNGSQRMEMAVDSQVSQQKNVILNHDFSEGLNSWHPNCCHAYVASEGSGLLDGVRANSGGNYVVVTQRTESWQGLEQDITGKITVGVRYHVLAYVRAYGNLQGPCGVQATLKLENQDSSINYLFVERVVVAKDRWERLEGSFSLTSMPKRTVFFLEGPPPGVDLLIDSVTVFCEEKNTRCVTNGDETIIWNPHFDTGIHGWSGRGCKILRHESGGDGKIHPFSGKFFASAIERSQSWNGIQQEITGRVQRKLAYEVTSVVQIAGGASSADVRATLWVQAPNGREQYIGIAKLQASDKEWIQLQGKFLLNGVASKVVIYLEGPPPGTDILVDSLVVKRAAKVPSSPPPHFEGIRGSMVQSQDIHSTNIISNYDFSKGLHSWSLNCCDGYVVSGESGSFKGVTAKTGTNYAVVTNRSEKWQGLEQDVTSKVSIGSTYNVSAIVRVWGAHQEPAAVVATLKLEYPNSPPTFVFVERVLVSKEQWETLEGSFSLTTMPQRVVFFLEGPSPGLDLLIDSVIISRPTVKQCENVIYGGNIIKNSTLSDGLNGLNGWSPLGSCTLRVYADPYHLFPSVASNSFGHGQSLSNRYILVTNRTETWMGPSQTITDKLKLHLTYRVAAWVRVGFGATGPQNVNVAVNVDDQWVNGGQVEANTDRWYEIKGSFRIEKQPSKVVVYVQGPSPGVDLMLGGLQIFPVDRKARIKHLKEKTEKVRKRDVVLKFPGLDSASLHGASIRIRQTQNSFPFGSCINRSNIENEEFVDFFVKNFNWAVFGNELKWYHTEPQQGKLNYIDADEMLNLCQRHGIETRGHCIFWEVEDAVQPWVQSLNGHELMVAIQNRLNSLLSTYKGKFRHYDVNNEMLHGSFYQDKLGKDIRAYMFRESHKLDPSAILFVNDYNVEDGCDPKSTPEMYIHQILDLQERGAPVGGIGIQAHISHPVGEIICDALDKLAILGLPIWFTELDVSAVNEHVRADDLEVVLREAFAHPAVEGVMLWGFWELFMFRENSHLVDAEGNINEAGKRYLALKQEWLSHADGHIDAHGEFKFRGYHGTYTVEITTPSGKKISRSFVVDNGDSLLVLTVN